MDVAREAVVQMKKPSPAATRTAVELTAAEAHRRLAAFGANTVPEEPPSSAKRFLAKFWGPIPWMLEAAILVQLALGVYVEAAVVAVLLLFNATLGFVQEGRASAALAALKKRLAPTALVRRDGEWIRHVAIDVATPSPWTWLLGRVPWPMLAIVAVMLAAALARMLRGGPVLPGPGGPAMAAHGMGPFGLLTGLFAKERTAPASATQEGDQPKSR